MYDSSREKEKNSANMTALTRHVIEHNHVFDATNVQVLDHEPNYHKRLILEALHIKLHKNAINYRSDVQCLSSQYHGLIKPLIK